MRCASAARRARHAHARHARRATAPYERPWNAESHSKAKKLRNVLLSFAVTPSTGHRSTRARTRPLLELAVKSAAPQSAAAGARATVAFRCARDVEDGKISHCAMPLVRERTRHCLAPLDQARHLGPPIGRPRHGRLHACDDQHASWSYASRALA